VIKPGFAKPGFRRSASVESIHPIHLPEDRESAIPMPKRSAAGVVMGQRSPRAIQLISSTPDLERGERSGAATDSTSRSRQNLVGSQPLSPRSRIESDSKRDVTGTSSAPLSPRVSTSRKVCISTVCLFVGLFVCLLVGLLVCFLWLLTFF
jgi:hypothetical protein